MPCDVHTDRFDAAQSCTTAWLMGCRCKACLDFMAQRHARHNIRRERNRAKMKPYLTEDLPDIRPHVVTRIGPRAVWRDADGTYSLRRDDTHPTTGQRTRTTLAGDLTIYEAHERLHNDTG